MAVIKNGNWINKDGQEIPSKYVSQKDKLDDKTVEQIVKIAKKLNQQLAEGKTKINTLLENYIKSSNELRKVNVEWKGNFTIMNFDKSLKVEKRIAEYIEFNNELQIAKGLIEQCINKWTDNALEQVKLIINDIFNIGKKKLIPRNNLIKLKKYKFPEPEWKQAMQIISEALEVSERRPYVNVYEKMSEKAYKQILLNFSAV